MHNSRLVLVTLVLLLAVTTYANASTVVVYPTFAKTAEYTTVVGESKGWTADSSSTIVKTADGSVYYIYALLRNEVLILVRENLVTGDVRTVVVDAGVSAVYKVAATDSVIAVSYFSYVDNAPEYKLYSIDLQAISEAYKCMPYAEPDPLTHQGGAIYCATDATPRSTSFVPTAVVAIPIESTSADGTKYYDIFVIVGAVHDRGNEQDVYTGMAYKLVVGNIYNEDLGVVANMGYIGMYSGSFGDVTPMYISVPSQTFASPYAYGLLVLWSQPDTYHQYIIHPSESYGWYVEDVGIGCGTYNTYSVVAAYSADYVIGMSDANAPFILPTVEVSTEYGKIYFIAGETSQVSYDTSLYLYVADTSNNSLTREVNITALLESAGYSPVLVNPFESNTIEPLYSGEMYGPGGKFYLMSIPVVDNSTGDYAYILLAYNPDDGNVRILRVLYKGQQMPSMALDNYRSVFLTGYVPLDTTPTPILQFDEFWVSVNPPYFQEPPGSTVQAQITSTVNATLVDVNAPQYITVDAPTSVSDAPQAITFNISPDAPEAEYGLITLTYRASDGTTFDSGVIYLTEQVNDPPTTPSITGAEIVDGIAHITWTESVDPDGDPVAYMVSVYDETDMVSIYEDNVTTTTISVPVTVDHTYTVYVTATDGNMTSETATYQFTYSLSMSVTLLDPQSGTYTVGTVPARVSYTTNVGSTLYIEVSLDGVSWNPVVQEQVSGSGTYTTSITLQPGNNYIRARLVYGADEAVSDIATVYYDNTSQHVMTIVEPADGATYQVAPGAQIEITFTAAFDTSSDTGNRTYKIVVTDTNGNAFTVASVSTDEPIYTLQGVYGLPAGEYLAYPVYVNPFGSEIYGPTVSFTVVETETPNNPPSVPILYSVSNTTDTNVWLQWHASSDPEGDPITYHVIVATDDQFQNVVFDSKTADTAILATNLYGGNVYYWKVQACDASGLCSAWSPYGSFVVYESTSINIDDPADGGAYVADDTNTATIPVKISVLTNTNKQFELNVLYTGGTIDYQLLQGPFDQTFEYNITLSPGEYNIVATMKDLETNEVYMTSAHITVYAYGTEAAPIIDLIDPSDGYYEEIDPTTGHTTITTRASFELPKEGNNYVAIEYKLKWAATWTTITDSTFTVTPDNNTTSLTANVDLTDGVYLFRAKVVDPDGITWYSETHTVVLRLSEAVPPQPPSEGGGGGGGGAGAAPIIVPEKVVWEVGSEETTIRTVTVKNVGTSPIKVKIWYDGEIAAYILAPPEESTMVIPPGDYNISFKVSGKGQPPGTVATGSIVLAPTGTTVEIPVELKIVEGTTGPSPGIDIGSLAVPIIIAGALVVMYLIYTGAI